MVENIKMFFNSNDSKISQIIHLLTSFRIDIKNTATKENNVIISGNEISIHSPDWAKNDYGNGWVIQGNTSQNIIKIKVVKDGILKFSFMGIDKRFEDKRIPIWTDYKSIKIDGKEILSVPISTWHDQPFRYEMSVKDGQEITLEFEQQYHKYTEQELNNILVKIGIQKDFIKNILDYYKNNVGFKEIEYTWDYVKNNILTQQPQSIGIDDITNKTSGRLQISVGNTKFESVLILSKTNKMYVFLTAGGSKDPYPLFHRISWCNKFDGMCLYLDDPTRIEHKMDSVAFYFGSKDINYADYICDIVLKVAKTNNIANKNIVFIASSNGGYAALYCCNKIQYSKCIALNPQIDIPLYLGRNTSFEKLMGINFDDTKYANRLQVLDILNNKNSKFFIFSNNRSNLDTPQMHLLFNKANQTKKEGLVKLTDNIFVLIANIEATNPHTAQPDEWFTSCIEQYMHEENKFPEYVFLYLIEEMRRYYDLLRQKESLENMVNKD